MKTFEQANKGAADMLARVVADYHPGLDEVDVEFLFHKDEKANGEAVRMRVAGYATPGVVKILGPVDRALGHGDVRIIVCKTAWDDMEQPEQRALLDHLLTRVERVGESGDLDEYDRPKLQKRRADFRLEGFREVAERHGEHAVEVRALERFANSPQLWLPGLDVVEPKAAA